MLSQANPCFHFELLKFILVRAPLASLGQRKKEKESRFSAQVPVS